jgi:anti-anti-sigma regulatory factor
MNTTFDITPYQSGGGLLKIKGNLTIKNCNQFKENLMKVTYSNGNFLLSLKDLEDIDMTGIQMIRSVRFFCKEAGKRLTIIWPQKEAIKNLLDRAGILKTIDK